MKYLLSLLAVSLFACGDGGSTGPTTTTTTAPTLVISGDVTTYRFELSRPGSDFGTISYVVTTRSNYNTRGCFVRVQWLDASGVQVSFTYAATNAPIPAGESTITDQQFVEWAIARRITNSRVEYSLCEIAG